MCSHCPTMHDAVDGGVEAGSEMTCCWYCFVWGSAEDCVHGSDVLQSWQSGADEIEPSGPHPTACAALTAL